MTTEPRTEPTAASPARVVVPSPTRQPEEEFEALAAASQDVR